MKYDKEDEFKIVKFLRFRCTTLGMNYKTYMPLKHIAKFINKSIAYVFRICKKIVNDSNYSTKINNKNGEFFQKYQVKSKEHFTEE